MLLRSLPLSAWCLCALVCSNVLAAEVESDEVPFSPVVIPLAVRSPYLGTYLQGSENKNLAKMSPRFWTTMPLGWNGLLRVDGQVSSWMGNLTEWEPTHNESISYTSTTSSFKMTDGPRSVALTASFLSPITPSDLFRQSIPFSYLSLSVESLDGEDHDVEVYTDIDGLWLADNEHEHLEWEAKETDEWSGLNIRLKNQRPFHEEEWTDHNLWGDLWYAARTTNEEVPTSWAAGLDAKETRRQFAETGTLGNSLNSTFRTTRTRTSDDDAKIIDEPVFAFSHSFKIRKGDSTDDNTALLTIGLVRDPIVQYKVAGPKVVQLKPLWTAGFDDLPSLISFFLGDYENVKKMSYEFNRKLYADARRVHSQEYGNVLAISTRQIFGALEGAVEYSDDPIPGMTTTVPTTGKNVSTLFMLKEVSSNGNVQTIDVIAPFLPFLLYAAPDLLPMLLEPTLRYSDTGLFKPTKLAIAHDIGDHYPNATGHDDYEGPTLMLENTGNILAMVLAGIRRGVPSALPQARKYWPIIHEWANSLSRTAEWPEMQSSTDDFFGPSANQTSLTVKGIIGVRAGAEIAFELDEMMYGDRLMEKVTPLVESFLDRAISKDKTHILSHYGNQTSWHGQYNFYYDLLFDFKLFPATMYEMQNDFYPTVNQPFGPALESDFPDRSKTDWLAWLAGCSPAGHSTRDLFINALSAYTRQLKNDVFGDYITPSQGLSVGFLTRPVVGGHYSLLGLDVMERLRNGEKVNEDFDYDLDEEEDWWTLAKTTKEWAFETAGKIKSNAVEGGVPRLVGLSFVALGLGMMAAWLLLRMRDGRKDSARRHLYKSVKLDETGTPYSEDSPLVGVITGDSTPNLDERKEWEFKS